MNTELAVIICYNTMNNMSVLHVFHVGQSVLNWCFYSILVIGRRTGCRHYGL